MSTSRNGRPGDITVILKRMIPADRTFALDVLCDGIDVAHGANPHKWDLVVTLGRWDTINLKVGGKTVIEVTDEGPWAGIHAAVVNARGANLWLNALRQQALWSTVACNQLVIKGANKEILAHCGMIRARARQHADWPSIQGGVHDTIRALSAGGKGRAGRSGEPQPWAIEELQRLADRELPMPAWWG